MPECGFFLSSHVVILVILGVCLAAFAVISVPVQLRAAHTETVSPPAGAGSPGGTAPASPVAPVPTVPGGPPSSGGSLPSTIFPGPARWRDARSHPGGLPKFPHGHAAAGRLRAGEIGRPDLHVLSGAELVGAVDLRHSAPRVGHRLPYRRRPDHDQRPCRRLDHAAHRPSLS